jgi:PAS domain S-box-containing protein/putative nucleotidyltransferase with HDIG domain
MGEKYYRKKIARVVVLFTFIPALIFASIFYRHTYENRMNDYLNENKDFMMSKSVILSNEVIDLNRKLRQLVPELIATNDMEKRAHLLNAFVNHSPKVLSAKSYSENQKWDEHDIHYYVSDLYTLRIECTWEELTGLQQVISIETSIENQVNWFTVNAKDTYFAMVSEDDILYISPELGSLSEYDLKLTSDELTLVSIGEERKNYYCLQRYFPNDNLRVYIFRADTTSVLIKEFYKDYIIKILLMLIVSMLVTYFVSLRLNYPFEKIRRAAENIIAGEYESKIENIDDELLSLNLSFNKMASLHQEKNEEFVQYAMTMLEKNENLTDLNQQLESSYDQLKTITEMLEYSKDKYQALFDHIKEFIWVFDTEGTLTYANDVMHEKLGFDKNELIGCHFFDIFLRFDEDDSLPQDVLIDQFMRRDFRNLSMWMRTKQNQEILLSANSKRIFKNGVIEGAQGTARTVEFEEMLQNRVLRKNREFEIIKEITWSLANNITLDSLLSNVVQKVEELFVPELCTIRIVENNQLVFKTGVGSLAEYARTDDFSIHDDFSGVAIKENKILRISDFENTQFYNKSSLELLLEKLQEVIVIPLENKGRIHGTINIGLSAPLSDAEVKIIKTLANQASIGIEKVMLYDQLKEDYLNTIRVLASAVEAKDKYTEGHSVRVSLIAKRIGEALGLEDDALEELEIAGMLHDIGKIGIQDDILTKRGALTIEEYDIMKSHPAVGKKILEPIGLSENIIGGVYMHHKRYDLSGYPEDIKIDHLSLYPAVIGVADAFDAMTSKRTYSEEKTLKIAMDELRRYKGQQFSPEVVDALEAIVAKDARSILNIIHS